MKEKLNLPLKSSFPFFSPKSIGLILRDIESSLKTGVITLGPRNEELEKKFAEYIQTKHAVAVSSGASSLEIALRYFGVKNREVVVPTNTFVATPNSVVFAGGKPIFSDIQEDTLCLNIDDVEHKISDKTAGVIVVHIAGLICPQINELRQLCIDRNLFLIEDCAHAHGSIINNQLAGTLGDVGCFSFAPTKGMTTGEGGILVTNDGDMAEKARFMRNRGLNAERLMVTLGNSWCMSEISAILGIHQLENLESFVARRNEIAEMYKTFLSNVAGVSLFRTPANVRNSFHKYPVKIAEGYDVGSISKLLWEKYGIETGRVYYPPCHLQPFYRLTFRTREGDFPVAEKTLKQVLCLPIHVAITDQEVEYISNSLKETLRK